MAWSTILNDLITEQLMTMHVAYIAKVISVTDGKKAKIQPLGKLKQYGQEAKSYSPLTNVPITDNAKYKIRNQLVRYINNDSMETVSKQFAVLEPISSGDIVLCICCDRNISSAIKGENTLPPSGNYHDMSNSIIVAIL